MGCIISKNDNNKVEEPNKVKHTMTPQERMQNEMFQMGNIHSRQRRAYD